MFFQDKYTDLEKELITVYANLKISLLGISKKEAEKMATDMVMLAKQKMEESGQDKLPPNFGNYILEEEKNNPKFMHMDIKRKDGVRDDDVLWLWNMNTLERCMLEVDDDNARLAAFMHYREEGISSEDAANRVRKFHAMYGAPEDTEHTKGDDRPLSPELKDRINIWLGKHMDNPEEFKNKLQRYSSINCLIREEIRNDKI